jgi:hypothetical protein
MYENLMAEVVSPENYGKALQAVIANQGAPGIDGMKTEELNGLLLKPWLKVQALRMAGTYRPSPVRREEIPKPNGGKRRLGASGGAGSLSGVGQCPFSIVRNCEKFRLLERLDN